MKYSCTDGAIFRNSHLQEFWKSQFQNQISARRAPGHESVLVVLERERRTTSEGKQPCSCLNPENESFFLPCFCDISCFYAFYFHLIKIIISGGVFLNRDEVERVWPLFISVQNYVDDRCGDVKIWVCITGVTPEIVWIFFRRNLHS